MRLNYFKFVALHRIDASPRMIRYEFFDGEDTRSAERAFDRVMGHLARFEGSVSVWSMPEFDGRWVAYKVKEVGR